MLPGEESVAPEKVFKTTKIVITADTFKVMGDHVVNMAFEYRMNPAAKTKIIDLQTAGDMGADFLGHLPVGWRPVEDLRLGHPLAH